MKIPPRPKKQTYWVILSHETGNLFILGYDPNDWFRYYYEGSHHSKLDDDDFYWDVIWNWVRRGSLECLGEL